MGPRSCWVCKSLLGKQVASQLFSEKKEGPSLPIHHILSSSPLAVLAGSTGSRGTWMHKFGGSFGMLEAPPNQGRVTRCHQQRRRRRRDGWFMAPVIHGEQRALGCCKDIFEAPDSGSFLGQPWRLMPTVRNGLYPSGWHVRVARGAAWVEEQINALRCQTP